jgi:hypothetical protein
VGSKCLEYNKEYLYVLVDVETGILIYISFSKKGESLQKNLGMEGEIATKGRQRNIDKGSVTINSTKSLCDEMAK